jgi:hypothetical protein
MQNLTVQKTTVNLVSARNNAGEKTVFSFIPKIAVRYKKLSNYLHKNVLL